MTVPWQVWTHTKTFKDKDAETLQIDFDQYVKMVKNFFITTGKDSVTDKKKVALLQAVGGPDMVDLVEEVWARSFVWPRWQMQLMEWRQSTRTHLIKQ